MKSKKIDVIATTISGSIQDWGKVKHIVPLFSNYGFNDVSLFSVDSHIKAREMTKECLKGGTRTIISAGGSGTFNSVLEGCCDSGIDLNEITLGFLRKGSADLIGKTLGMPDNIDEAIKVFVDSINEDKKIKCDVILASSEYGKEIPRHFVGYGGAEIFGDIPSYTENRFIKYYKGIFSQIFGDLGPFFIGASLACISKSSKSIFKGKRKWHIFVDDKKVSENIYQALIIVNGDLGKDLPLARNVPLGSEDFYLFSLKDLGLFKLPVVPSAVYADLVYEVKPYTLDGGFTIDGGSIAVSEMAADDGILRGDEVGSFTFFGSGFAPGPITWMFSSIIGGPFRVVGEARIDLGSIWIAPDQGEYMTPFFGVRDRPTPDESELIYRSNPNSFLTGIGLDYIGEYSGNTTFPAGSISRLTVATRIPEASPVPFMGLVTAGLFGYRRRKRKLANVKS